LSSLAKITISLFSRWSRWNIELCDAIARRLPESFTRSLLYLHEVTVTDAMNARPRLAVLDVGGGSDTPFAAHRIPQLSTWLVVIDIMEQLLRQNRAVDARLVADACRGIPFKGESIDVIVTRSVMEHLPDNIQFLNECHRLLKRDGLAMCVMPSRRAPFAWAQSSPPGKLSRNNSPG
jgi:ubiquinone/menaquinone biosynthesis C-methylase UbiE